MRKEQTSRLGGRQLQPTEERDAVDGSWRPQDSSLAETASYASLSLPTLPLTPSLSPLLCHQPVVPPPVFVLRPSVSLSWVLLTRHFLLVSPLWLSTLGSQNPSLVNCLHKQPRQEGPLLCPSPTSCPTTTHPPTPNPRSGLDGPSVSHSVLFSDRSPSQLVQVQHLPHLCQVTGHHPQLKLVG